MIREFQILDSKMFSLLFKSRIISHICKYIKPDATTFHVLIIKQFY